MSVNKHIGDNYTLNVIFNFSGLEKSKTIAQISRTTVCRALNMTHTYKHVCCTIKP